MATGPGDSAGLDTLPACLTLPGVTDLDAPVTATGERPPALSATGDSLNQTGNISPLLAPTVAALVGQSSAGGAVSVAVAGVEDGVTAGVISPAELCTVRRPGTTGDWRVDDGSPALAGEL